MWKRLENILLFSCMLALALVPSSVLARTPETYIEILAVEDTRTLWVQPGETIRVGIEIHTPGTLGLSLTEVGRDDLGVFLAEASSEAHDPRRGRTHLLERSLRHLLAEVAPGRFSIALRVPDRPTGTATGVEVHLESRFHASSGLSEKNGGGTGEEDDDEIEVDPDPFQMPDPIDGRRGRSVLDRPVGSSTKVDLHLESRFDTSSTPFEKNGGGTGEEDDDEIEVDPDPFQMPTPTDVRRGRRTAVRDAQLAQAVPRLCQSGANGEPRSSFLCATKLEAGQRLQQEIGGHTGHFGGSGVEVYRIAIPEGHGGLWILSLVPGGAETREAPLLAEGLAVSLFDPRGYRLELDTTARSFTGVLLGGEYFLEVRADSANPIAYTLEIQVFSDLLGTTGMANLGDTAIEPPLR